uniref:Otolith matrix protein n=1 Tax=Salmo trutta TaxID=8032 RepID=A0A674DG96_SALTR
MTYRDRRLAVTLLLFSFISFSTQKTFWSDVFFSWCVVSEAEEQECLDLAGSATARNIRGTLLCVRGQSPTDCMEKIKNGTADAAAMFADDIYTADWCYGLELAAGESYNGVDGISYCVVALARRSSSDLSLLEMHERRERRGWGTEVGRRRERERMRGWSTEAGRRGEREERRGGEAGALRCVAENLGNVAFHFSLETLGDLKLLCPDGSEAGLFDHETCHLAVVPANAVVVRQYLERLQLWWYNVFGNITMFSSVGYAQSDLLFSDSTHHLLRVVGSYTSWLGPTYTTVLQHPLNLAPHYLSTSFFPSLPPSLPPSLCVMI